MKDKKYIWLPVALLLYTVAMAIYSWHINGGPSDGFWTIVAIELTVVAVLFVLLRRRHRRRQ